MIGKRVGIFLTKKNHPTLNPPHYSSGRVVAVADISRALYIVKRAFNLYKAIGSRYIAQRMYFN